MNVAALVALILLSLTFIALAMSKIQRRPPASDEYSPHPDKTVLGNSPTQDEEIFPIDWIDEEPETRAPWEMDSGWWKTTSDK